MLTITHLAFDFLLWFLFGLIIEVSYIDLILILGVSLIDLDHLWSKPIFKSGRNSFKTHFLHKNWKLVSIVAVIFLFIRPIMFLGLGILSHFLLDYLDNLLHKKFKKK